MRFFKFAQTSESLRVRNAQICNEVALYVKFQ